MTIKTFTFNPFQTHCYVCHDAGEAAVVDPSCHEDWEVGELLKYIESEGLEVKHILLTHAHLDHIFGCAAVTRALGKGFQVHRADAPLLLQASTHAEMLGVTIEEPPPPESYLEEEDTLTLGRYTWGVLHTPGHSPGSVSFLDPSNQLILSGDVLFYDSIGRTDLWQGSLPTLMHSIFNKLLMLDDRVNVYPGHGPATTIGREKHQNPFIVEAASS